MKFFKGIFVPAFIMFFLTSSIQIPVNPHDFIPVNSSDPGENISLTIIDDLIDSFTLGFICPNKKPSKTLAGDWKMTLASVKPPVPDIPIVNPIKKDSTWKISSNLAILYDEKPKWYNEPPGLSFTVKAPSIKPNDKKTTCTYSGGGTAFKDAFGIPIIAWYTNISATYSDSVTIIMISDDTITATIQVTLTGQFNEGNKINPINETETIVYTGVRIK